MADHARTQVRDAVIAALTGLTTTGPRAGGLRLAIYEESELPALEITTPEEDANPAGFDGTVRRAVLVQVTGTAKQDGDIDKTLDTIAKETEAALLAPLTVGAAAVRVDYEGMRKTFDDSTDLHTGAIEMRFRADLFTTAPDSLLNG